MKHKLNSVNRKKRWAITDKMFFSLFMTGTIIEFSQVGAGFVDGLIISRFLGSDAMAAEGIVHPVFSIFGIISGLFAVGMQTRCAREIGRGNRENYLRFVSAAVYAGAILSVIITVLLIIFARPFSVLLGASGNAADLADPASRYLTGLSIGAFPLIMTVVLSPALQLDTGRRYIQTGALLEAVFNVIMDIFAVKSGWGLFGVGLATAAASYLNLLCLCTFFLNKDRTLRFVRANVSVKEFLKMLSNGSEKAVRRLANTLRPVILNSVIISYGGAAAMSVLSVRNNFSNFAEIYGAGIASAVSLLAGVYYGEINEEGIEEVNRFEHRMVLCFSGSIALLIMVFAKQIARLYIPDNATTYDMAVFAIRMLALQIPIQALIESRIKYLQAIQRKRNMQVLTLCTRLLFIVLSALILGNLFGSMGILACFTVSDALTLVVVFAYYTIKTRNLPPTRRDFLNLPDEFRLHPGDVISLDIQSIDDVSLASEQIMLFCNGHKINGRIAYCASLAFEELASNIVRHGFAQSSSSSPMIDLRVVVSGDNLAVRLRDNCPKYDVTRQIASVIEDESDLEHNIGIRVVSRIASDITYLNTFDTNSLIIRFKL